MSWRRVFVIVLDSVGIGELPDAVNYDDVGANTLGHIAERVATFRLPNLQALGLGNIAPLNHVPPAKHPKAYFAKMAEQSVGKDTMTGHWELMGLHVDTPFRTFPDGFPAPLMERFCSLTGRRAVGNKPASGTDILLEFGEHQMKTGDWIVYTSADSVFQIAAHEEIIPLNELYAACEIARELTLHEPWKVGRVIARPYIGQSGTYTRTAHRHDYAVRPPRPTILHSLQTAGLETISVGKIFDIFCGEGINQSYPTKSNEHGMNELLRLSEIDFHGLCFANLVDFDSVYGHRRDVEGYARALMEFDFRLKELLASLRSDDLLIITADHGNDPTHHGTDHTREYVPLLVYDPSHPHGQDLGVRSTFADVSATIAELFTVSYETHGVSFCKQLHDQK